METVILIVIGLYLLFWFVGSKWTGKSPWKNDMMGH